MSEIVATTTLPEIAREIRLNLRDNYDQVVAITGLKKGMGKSHLAIQLGEQIDDNFDYKKNIAYLPDSEQIQKQFNELKRYQCYDVDEAIKVLYKLRWMDKLQQIITEMYETERKQNKCTLLLIPRFRDLTENFRNHQVDIWINIIARGLAVVRMKDPDQDVKDPWYFDINERRKKDMFGSEKIWRITLEKRIQAESRMKNYVGTFFFDALPDEKEQLYLACHKEAKDNMPPPVEKTRGRRQEKDDLFRYRAIKKFQAMGITLKEIGDMTNVTPGAISNLIKDIEKRHPELV